jgi:hypothetical protein
MKVNTIKSIIKYGLIDNINEINKILEIEIEKYQIIKKEKFPSF